MKENPKITVKLVVAVLLLAALFNMPFAYYQFMRIAVCCLFIWLAAIYYKKSQMLITLFCGAMVILFNPLFKLVIHKDNWQTIDIWLGIALIVWALGDMFMIRFNRISEENRLKNN